MLADVIFVMWTGYTGSRYFSILRRVLKRRQFSASHYNVPLLAHVYNFVWNAGSSDDHLYSVSCIANTVFTLKEICARWDTLWWITMPLYPPKVGNYVSTKEWGCNSWNPTYENTYTVLAGMNSTICTPFRPTHCSRLRGQDNSCFFCNTLPPKL